MEGPAAQLARGWAINRCWKKERWKQILRIRRQQCAWGQLSFLMGGEILEEGLVTKGWGWADVYGALVMGPGLIVTLLIISISL